MLTSKDMRRTPEGYFTSRWGLPEYTDWIDESMSWKETVYIGDWSPLEKFRVKGPEALKFFSSIAVNSFAKFDVGQAKRIWPPKMASEVRQDDLLILVPAFVVTELTAAFEIGYFFAGIDLI